MLENISRFSSSRLPPRRTEPQCITCDDDLLFASRYYYGNCSHFGAFVVPQSSISSDAGVEFYILECLGPGLPLAGEFHAKEEKKIVLKSALDVEVGARWNDTSTRKAFLGASFRVCERAKMKIFQLLSTSFSSSLSLAALSSA